MPHVSTSRKLVNATNVTTGINGREHAKYLKDIASKLSHQDKHVILQLDEIHVNAMDINKSGNIVGAVSNVLQEPV